MKKIGIITINYKSEDLLKKFITSVLEQNFRDWVMVVINNSPDDIAINKVIKSFSSKKIFLLSINKNVGYSKGNNLGFNYLLDNHLISREDIVLFSNEDIIINDKDFLGKAVEIMEELNCGFMGPKIINNDGSLMMPHSKKANFLKCIFHMGNNGLVDKIFGINKNLKKITEFKKVFLLNGAFFFCNAENFINVGMFDTNTFIYYAEELLFRNVDKLNIDVIYYPSIEVYHEHSASVKKSFSILRKKKFVYEGEYYFLTNILKVNKFLLLLFKLERNIEFLLVKFVLAFKSIKK